MDKVYCKNCKYFKQNKFCLVSTYKTEDNVKGVITFCQEVGRKDYPNKNYNCKLYKENSTFYFILQYLLLGILGTYIVWSIL